MYFVLKILKILFTLFRSTCFGHPCVHHQELLLMMAPDDGHKGVRNMYSGIM